MKIARTLDVNRVRAELRTLAGYDEQPGLPFRDQPDLPFLTTPEREERLQTCIRTAVATYGLPIHFFSVARDFTDCPGGRKRSDHSKPGFSGEELRALLVPLLESCRPVEGQPRVMAVVVDLNGTAGYAGSFLDEVFGGLITVEGFDADELDQYLILVDTDMHAPGGRGYRQEILEDRRELARRAEELVWVFRGPFGRDNAEIYLTMSVEECKQHRVNEQHLAEGVSIAYKGRRDHAVDWKKDNPLPVSTKGRPTHPSQAYNVETARLVERCGQVNLGNLLKAQAEAGVPPVESDTDGIVLGGAPLPDRDSTQNYAFKDLRPVGEPLSPGDRDIIDTITKMQEEVAKTVCRGNAGPEQWTGILRTGPTGPGEDTLFSRLMKDQPGLTGTPTSDE